MYDNNCQLSLLSIHFFDIDYVLIINILNYCFMCSIWVCRDVFMEKHWKSAVARSLCDYFFDQQRRVLSPEDTPPVIATPHHYLISIYRCNMFFVAVCMTEGKLDLVR